MSLRTILFNFQSTVKLFFRFKSLERALLVMDFRHSLNGCTCYSGLKRMQLEKWRFLHSRLIYIADQLYIYIYEFLLHQLNVVKNSS